MQVTGGGGLRLFLRGGVPPISAGSWASFSSKTPIKSNLGVASSSSKSPEFPRGATPFPIQIPKGGGAVTLLSSQREPQPPPKKQSLLHHPPTLVDDKQLATNRRVRKRKEILRIPEAELEGYAILVRKPSLLERRGEATGHYLKAWTDPTKKTYIDFFSFFHGDWDLRPKVIKRWWKSLDTEVELNEQAYNPNRNKVLGNDLAISHFVVARKGRVRFRGHTEWVTEYRKDSKEVEDEDDLPVMSFDLCTLPVRFDPRYRVEAIDCTGIPILYEGLVNFQNLSFVKWLSFRDGPFLDDWCLDRITRIFHETLEYIDLSGCTRVSERGIGALVKCRNLKTLVVENLPHARHLEMVTAMLEDTLPELVVIGVDYTKKMEQIKLEGEEIERKILAEAEKLEANTVTIEESSSVPTQSQEETKQSDHSSRR